MVRSNRKRESLVKDAPTARKTQKKSSLCNNSLVLILSDYQFYFPEDREQPNEIGIDQVTLQQNLSNGIRTDKKMIDAIMNGIEKLWLDPYRFCFSVLPTNTTEDCMVSTRGKQQDSLVRICLGTKELQAPLAGMLLEKLSELTSDDEHANVANKLGGIDLIHIIVNQLRWLDSIVDSKGLLQKLFDVLSVTDVGVQQELIAVIPDVIDDNSSPPAADQLRQLLIEKSELIPAILDSLSNINFKGELLDQVRGSVLQILSSAAVSDLPVVVKFLLHSVNDQNVIELISEIREKLDFTAKVIPNHASTPFQGKRLCSRGQSKTSENHDVMIFESIKCGLRFQKLLGDSWLKVEDSISSSEDQKVLDVFVLLVLYHTKNKRKQIETLMRNKIKNGVFSEEMFTVAVCSYSDVFGDYLNEIILLAETFLHSPEVVVSNYGCNLYKQAFINFNAFSQQEVIGALVTHIGSGYGPEVEAAFLVLNSLVEKETTKMVPFTIFLKGILDYMDKLSISQIRTLFSVISQLTLHAADGDNIGNDDMCLLIRKQLSSPTLKYKRIGIVGAIMIISNIGKKRVDILDSTSITAEYYNQVISLLQLVQNNVKNKTDASALFYDELANVIRDENLDEKVLSWIGESIISDFQEEYLVDVDTLQISSDKRLHLCFDLDEPEEGGISVNILSLMLADVENNKEKAGSSSTNMTRNSLTALPAQFRLVRLCEQKLNNGSLEGIDALLGCPIVLFNDDILNGTTTMAENERFLVCESLIHAINWIREGLNAFTEELADADTRGKILARIKTLVSLSSSLEKCLKITKNFNMPIADFGIDESLLAGIKPLKAQIETKQIKRSNNKSKKKLMNCTEVTEVTEVEDKSSDKEGGEEACIESDPVTGESNLSLSQFPASFREFDLNIFYALSYGSVNKSYMDTEMNRQGKEEIKLTLNEIQFLLVDLIRKLDHALTDNRRPTFLKQSVTKLIGFSHLPKPTQVFEFMLKILPALSSIYQQCVSHFQKVNNENDGLVDCEALRSNESKEFLVLYDMLINIMLQCLQWDGFQCNVNKPLLVNFLQILVKHLVGKDVSSQLASLTQELFICLTDTNDILPSIQIAVKIIKILLILKKHTDDTWNQTGINEILLKFLQRTWMNSSDGGKDRGAVFNDHYSFLMRTYISVSKDHHATLETLCKGPITDLVKNGKKNDDGTELYPCLTRNSFPAIYRCLFEELISSLKNEISNLAKKDTVETVVVRRLEIIQKSMQIFQILNSASKEMESRNALLISLKLGRAYLEVFLKSAMPLLDRTLRTHKNLVHGILKSAQQSTRALQHLCGHSKISKDVSMTTYVPALKKCLEMFVFRVKAMLAYNNCDSAFWLGNLKNRDLRGNEILSQVETTNASSSNNSDQDEDENQSIAEEETEECSESF